MMLLKIIAGTALAITAIGFSAITSFAANVSVVDRRNCHVRLDGDFAPGDDERLEAAERRVVAERAKKDNHERDVLICFNSTGGDPSAVSAVIEYIRKAIIIGTVVDGGDKCHSLCALVFMMGRTYEHHTITFPLRFLHPKGDLAFHLPYQSAETADGIGADRAFGDAVRQVARIMSMDDQHTRLTNPAIPRSLLARMLINGPDIPLVVETVGDASAWYIDLIDTRQPSIWTYGMLLQACQNKYPHHKGTTDLAQANPSISRDAPVHFKANRARVILSGFGDGGQEKCLVDLYRSAEHGTFMQVTERLQPEAVPKADELEKQVQSLLKSWKRASPAARHNIPTCCITQGWKVYPPTTRLSSLAK